MHMKMRGRSNKGVKSRKRRRVRIKALMSLKESIIKGCLQAQVVMVNLSKTWKTASKLCFKDRVQIMVRIEVSLQDIRERIHRSFIGTINNHHYGWSMIVIIFRGSLKNRQATEAIDLKIHHGIECTWFRNKNRLIFKRVMGFRN